MNKKVRLLLSVFLQFLILSYSEVCCQNNSILAKYDMKGARITKTELLKYLNEVSGLAIFGSKWLIMHNDEEGILYLFDLHKKRIENKLLIGNKKICEDFEGIAVMGDTIFLSTSNGKIYCLGLKNSDLKVLFVTKMNIKDKIDLEGLCYDKITSSLFIPNKIPVAKKHNDERVIYRYKIENEQFIEDSFITISLKELKKKFNIDNLSPTAVEIHPLNGHLILLSSHEKCLLEIARNGEILAAIKLDGKNHVQPEGLTFLEDYSLVISDEASGKKPLLTIIPFGQ